MPMCAIITNGRKKRCWFCGKKPTDITEKKRFFMKKMYLALALVFASCAVSLMAAPNTIYNFYSDFCPPKGNGNG